MYQSFPLSRHNKSFATVDLKTNLVLKSGMLVSQANLGHNNHPIFSNQKTKPNDHQQSFQSYNILPCFWPNKYLAQPNQTANTSIKTQQSVNKDLIQENTIYCVVCQTKYKQIDRQEHINKHRRKNKMTPMKQHITDMYHNKTESKKKYIIKPIVEPEQYTIQYEPTVYSLTKLMQYYDESFVQKSQKGIGDQNNSFSEYDHNLTFNSNTMNYVPNRSIKTESNPFIVSQIQLNSVNPSGISAKTKFVQKADRKNQKMISPYQTTINRQQISQQNDPIVSQPIHNTRELIDRLRSFSEAPYESSKTSNGSVTNLLKEEYFTN